MHLNADIVNFKKFDNLNSTGNLHFNYKFTQRIHFLIDILYELA